VVSGEPIERSRLARKKPDTIRLLVPEMLERAPDQPLRHAHGVVEGRPGLGGGALHGHLAATVQGDGYGASDKGDVPRPALALHPDFQALAGLEHLAEPAPIPCFERPML